jgi:DNA polymerase I-like protein with 3'-5' exonuclease and polymerase domains
VRWQCACALQARSQAERQAVNTVTQGSAADMIKRAMVRLHQLLAQPRFQGAARLVLQVRLQLLPPVFQVLAAHVAHA